MYCKKCGTQIADGISNCPHCGQPVSQTLHQANSTTRVQNTSSAGSPGIINSVADSINTFTGYHDHVELRVSNLFDEVFKHHTNIELLRVFTCGTPETTPSIRKASSAWPHPWVYSRVLLVLLAAVALSIGLNNYFGDVYSSLPIVVVVGSLVVPITTVVLFFETNVPRNIHIIRVFEVFILSAFISIIMLYRLSAILPKGGTGDLVPSMLTGLSEELAKILIIAFFLSRTKGKNYILNGLLIGAAVGAGFAWEESVGYAFGAWFENLYYSMSEQVELATAYNNAFKIMEKFTFVRGVLSIGGHVAWAAVEGAALAICDDGKGFKWGSLFDMRFLSMAMLCIALHGIWDAEVPVIDTIEYALMGDQFLIITPKYLLLIIAIWFLIIIMMHRGLQQINEICRRVNNH